MNKKQRKARTNYIRLNYLIGLGLEAEEIFNEMNGAVTLGFVKNIIIKINREKAQ